MPKPPTKESGTQSLFGETLSTHLIGSNMTQTALANSVGASRSYVSYTLSGQKKAHPEWVNLVAEALNLSPENRAQLHRAAAIDAGYELDLTKM